MAMSLLPITARLRHRLGRDDFAAGAFATEEIAPAMQRFVPPALCLPDDWDRIIAFQEETTPELERQRAAGGLTDHGATRIARHRDVTLIDGIAYGRKGMLRASNRYRQRPIARGERVTIPRALLCTNPVIDRYFGHWLVDGLLLELLAAEQDAVPLKLSPHRWLHEPGYRALTGLDDCKAKFVHVEELLVADDRGINASWQARATTLRARIAAGAGSASADAPVFVRRGTTGSKRDLMNEGELAEALAARGFVILSPEQETPQTIAATLAAAPVIVLVEGSAQDHALVAARTGAWVVTIMPPRRINCFAKVRADALGLNWAYTVADDAGEGSFHQPLDRLLRLIERTKA